MEIFIPFSYSYMVHAMWVSSLVGGVCAFLSAYLMLKGWSLIGDALSHSIVPGVAVAYIIGFPFSLGAFGAGGLAAVTMLFLNQRTSLKQDAIIGLIFTGFFGLGLFIASLSPMSVSIQTIIMGNILAITMNDMLQLVIIAVRGLSEDPKPNVAAMRPVRTVPPRLFQITFRPPTGPVRAPKPTPASRISPWARPKLSSAPAWLSTAKPQPAATLPHWAL